jgi:hypothetical protein
LSNNARHISTRKRTAYGGRAAPELIRDDQKEQREKKAQKKKRNYSLIPPPLLCLTRPPTHAQKEWGELILFFFTEEYT